MLINNIDDVVDVLNLLERKVEILENERADLLPYKLLERKLEISENERADLYKRSLKTNKRIDAVEKLFNNINDLNIIDLDIDNCVDDVIRLVNKYHYLVDDNGLGTDNKFFSDDVKNIITKYINKGVRNA